MSLPTVILLALALAMDAFAVSICSGATIEKMRLRHALRIAGFFGFFQAVMPVAGWSAGRYAAELIKACDHWIAFGLLTIVGGKMIYEALVFKAENEKRADPLNLYILFTLAIATSIDAAAVGISLSLLAVGIVQPAIIIGCVTFLVSLAGTWIGCRCGVLFGEKIEIAGGIVLIGIGCKILVEHLFFNG
ncbi:MAG: manganese efflux pump [Chitinispirillaceae bacterium]|nr:manganese efflux pump [Chitinispirillaceae bacterium]